MQWLAAAVLTTVFLLTGFIMGEALREFVLSYLPHFVTTTFIGMGVLCAVGFIFLMFCFLYY